VRANANLLRHWRLRQTVRLVDAESAHSRTALGASSSNTRPSSERPFLDRVVSAIITCIQPKGEPQNWGRRSPG
jgi:hypothetical protein